MNIALFHAGPYRRVARWNLHVLPPRAARAAGVISAVAWMGAIFCGRFLAY